MKKIALAIISIGLVLALASCTWRLPETVSIKTDAEYNFSLGTFEKNLDSELNMSSMMGNAGDGDITINFYDYFPGKLKSDVQHYLLEVKLIDQEIIPAITDENALNALFGSDESKDISAFSVSPIPAGKKNLDFNPATMLSSIKGALGDELADKLSFHSVPMYVYIETARNLTATPSTLQLYYETAGAVPHAGIDPVDLLPSGELSNKTKPAFVKEGDTVVTNLGNDFIELATLINQPASTIENDKLCASYSIGAFSGTISRAEAKAGVKLVVYAVIDIPVCFNVTDDISLDLNSMSGLSSGSGSGSGSSSSNVEVPDTVKKVLDVVNGISIKFTANKLPIHKISGTMKLGVDLLNNGDMKEANLSDSGKKESFSLSRPTLNAFKESPSFNPKIVINIYQDTVFSIPREKAVNMYIELSVKTGGKIQVM